MKKKNQTWGKFVKLSYSKNGLHWNRSHALKIKPLKTYQIEKKALKNGK